MVQTNLLCPKKFYFPSWKKLNDAINVSHFCIVGVDNMYLVPGMLVQLRGLSLTMMTKLCPFLTTYLSPFYIGKTYCSTFVLLQDKL